MKYFGVSSPCWTFSGHDVAITGRPKEVVTGKTKLMSAMGPGKYTVDNEFRLLHKSQSTYSFGNAQRFKLPKTDQTTIEEPQPVSEVRARFPERPIFREASASKSKNTRRHKSFAASSAQNFFTTSQRIGLSKNALFIPGPGTYDMPSDQQSLPCLKYSFGYKFDGFESKENSSCNLGPGSYDPKPVELNSGVKMNPQILLPKQPIKKLANKSANASHGLRNVESVKTGLGEHPDKEGKRNPDDQRRHRKQHSTFSKASRDEYYRQLAKQSGPSPTTYNVHEMNPAQYGNWKAKAYSLGTKTANKREEDGHQVAPWEYTVNPELFKKHKGFTFSKAEEKTKEKPIVVSQDSFESKSEMQEEPNVKLVIKGGVFGKAERDQNRMSNAPGPGAYQPSYNLVNKTAPGTLIGAKLYRKRYKFDDESENNKLSILEPKYTGIDPNTKFGKFGSAVRQANQTKLVKSRFENVKDAMFDITQKIGVGGFTFDKSAKIPQVEDQNVEIGPGFYEIKSTIAQVQPWIKIQHKNQV